MRIAQWTHSGTIGIFRQSRYADDGKSSRKVRLSRYTCDMPRWRVIAICAESPIAALGGVDLSRDELCEPVHEWKRIAAD